MMEAEGILVDAREQVRLALSRMDCAVPFTLRADFPRGPVSGNMVVWGEYANTATDCPVVDRIVFQVDLYAPDRQSRQALAQAVNAAMSTLGLRRIYASADLYEDIGEGCYCKRYRFGRRVDKRSMRLID